METNILILGKGDSVITMILDNLYSNQIFGNITIYNNMSLSILKEINHPFFNIDIRERINLNDFNNYVLGVYEPKHKIEIVKVLNPNINKCKSIFFNDFYISATSNIGFGCLVDSKVSVSAHTTIGNFVSINRHVSIGHHTIIDDFVSINPGCNIAGNVKIGKGTTLGMGTNVLNTIEIGENSFIGAGSNVTRNIPSNVIAYGNPCKVIKKI